MLRFLVGLLIYLPSLYCLNDSIALSPNDFVKLETAANGTKMKSLLRYGFHKTAECHDFEKSYLCIQKCLDLKYDIAYANKKCNCMCSIKKDKAKYMDKSGINEKLKLGAPTTKIPVWAQPKTKKIEETHEDEHMELNVVTQTTLPSNETVSDKVSDETEVSYLADITTVIPVSDTSPNEEVGITTEEAADITTVVT